MKLQKVLIAVSALFLVACGKQNNNNSGSTRINRQTNANAVIGTTTCNQSTWGKIYDSTVDDNTFRQRVADFTLRTLDEVGNVSGAYNSQTGINFQMTLNFQNGQLVQNGTQAAFRITDSITLNENGGYISFLMGAMGGSGQGGQFNAQVGDSKGYVRFQGYKTTSGGQQIVYGQVFYNNYGQGEQYLGEFVNGSCAVTGI